MIGLIATMLFLAFAVERVVELVFGKLFDQYEVLHPYKWALMYIAIAIGVFAAYQFKLDMLSELGLIQSDFGYVITGVVIGGGSNFAHDILSKLGGDGK